MQKFVSVNSGLTKHTSSGKKEGANVKKSLEDNIKRNTIDHGPEKSSTE